MLLTQARGKFEEWQKSHWFAPNRLLDQPGVNVRGAFLPFWAFDAKVSVEYSAVPGFPKPAGHEGYTWGEQHTGTLPEKEFSGSLPEMQVYASFKYRRDLAEAAKTPLKFVTGQQLSAAEAESLRIWDKKHGFSWQIDPPNMRQGLAWEFALRGIHHLQVSS